MSQVLVRRTSDRCWEVMVDSIIIAKVLADSDYQLGTVVPMGDMDVEDVLVVLQAEDISRSEPNRVP